jgi:hypothetical protein
MLDVWWDRNVEYNVDSLPVHGGDNLELGLEGWSAAARPAVVVGPRLFLLGKGGPLGVGELRQRQS